MAWNIRDYRAEKNKASVYLVDKQGIAPDNAYAAFGSRQLFVDR